MNSKKSQLKIGAIIAYCGIFFNIVSGLLYTPWMINQIGSNEYGLYTLANSLIAMFIMDFGLSSATSRYVAKYRAENDKNKINTFLNITYRLYLIIDAFIFLALIVVFLCIDLIYGNLSSDEIHKFKVVYCIAGLYSIISFPCVTFNGILNAYEDFLPIKVADMIQKVFTVILTTGALWIGLGLYSLVAINAVCGLVAIIIKWFYVNKNARIVKIKVDPVERKQIVGEVFRFSAWSTVWALAQRLIFNITPTIISMRVPDAAESVSVFGIITTVEGYFYTITTALNGMFLSKITRIVFSEDDGCKLTSLATTVGRFQFGLNGLLIVGFALVGKDFISLWVGDDFREAYYGILLVVIPGIFYNSLQIIHTAFVVQNLVKHQALIQIMIGIVNVGLSWILSYNYGVIGASLSIFVAYFLRLILTIILVKRKMKFDFNLFIKDCYLRMSAPVIVAFVSGLVLTELYAAPTWINLVLRILMISIIYIICVCAFGLKRTERLAVCKIIVRKVKHNE